MENKWKIWYRKYFFCCNGLQFTGYSVRQLASWPVGWLASLPVSQFAGWPVTQFADSFLY